ncbi:hypothetical protein JYT59_00920 [Sphingobacteriaceae bacterium AH-315-L07]|nr:hypothetical protein [Sphingobacteriaceae bacterium AH-315-L07]
MRHRLINHNDQRNTTRIKIYTNTVKIKHHDTANRIRQQNLHNNNDTTQRTALGAMLY